MLLWYFIVLSASVYMWEHHQQVTIVLMFQVGTFYRKVLTEEEKIRLCRNIAGHLKDAQEFIQKRAVR